MTEPVIVDNGRIILPPRKSHLYRLKLGFAFVSDNDEQVTSFVSCRDYLHDEIRVFVNNKTAVAGDGHPYEPKNGDPDIYMDKLKLLLLLPSYSKTKLLHALKVLNTIEFKGGMPITTAEVVTTFKDNKNDAHILLNGSSEYINNPHLLSLLTLVIRFCLYNNKFDVNDEYCIRDYFATSKKTLDGVADYHIMTDCYKLIHIIMKNRETLFKGLTLNDLFPVNVERPWDFHSAGGIQQLCLARSLNSILNKRIKSLIQNNT